jgi:hypothetical protein
MPKKQKMSGMALSDQKSHLRLIFNVNDSNAPVDQGAKDADRTA